MKWTSAMGRALITAGAAAWPFRRSASFGSPPPLAR